MTIQDKNKWRLRFKLYAASLVLMILIIGAYLAFQDKGDNFAIIAGSVITFATGVFGVDYFSKPTQES